MTTQEEWSARFPVLVMVATIIQTVNFDKNGLSKEMGEHQRCDLAAIYYSLKAENGDGESLWDGGKAYFVFEPTELERQILNLNVGPSYYVSERNEEGFVFGRETTREGYERIKCHSDNPDDEVEDIDPSESDVDLEDDEDRIHGDGDIEPDGEIEF